MFLLFRQRLFLFKNDIPAEINSKDLKMKSDEKFKSILENISKFYRKIFPDM
jgi:hypothetical protein